MRRRFLGYLGCNEGERDVGMQLHLKLAEEPGVLVAVGYTAQSNCNAINDIQDTSTQKKNKIHDNIEFLLTCTTSEALKSVKLGLGFVLELRLRDIQLF